MPTDIIPAKRATGAPSKLTPKLALRIHFLARRGLTDEEIAQIVDVTRNTIENWKLHPLFFNFLKSAKVDADNVVVRSLYERAVGYEYWEEKVFVHEGRIITHPSIKHVPPDVTACIFWLKNRQSGKWKDRMPEEGGGPKIVNIIYGHTQPVDPKQAGFVPEEANGHR